MPGRLLKQSSRSTASRASDIPDRVMPEPTPSSDARIVSSTCISVAVPIFMPTSIGGTSTIILTTSMISSCFPVTLGLQYLKAERERALTYVKLYKRAVDKIEDAIKQAKKKLRKSGKKSSKRPDRT
jgi:hypothetical protein